MAEDDYETLPENASVLSHMLAGACAGIMEHTIIYPVDCVKVFFNYLLLSRPTFYNNWESFQRFI